MELSRLHIYSLGLVAANKKLSSREIEVTPIEHANFVNGEVTDNVSQYASSAKDASGKAYATSVQTTVTVKATWLPIGSSNRKTAPDVRRGEMVAIYRFADTDQFWWCTLKDDLHLRKLETVIYAFSGTTKEDVQMDASNTYFLEISTHQKLIHLHTSKDNGEPYSYDIQINTGEGFIQIQDDDGNVFKFDSADRHLLMLNKDGTKMELNKRIFNVESLDQINMKTRDFSLQTDNTNIVGNSQVTVGGGHFLLTTQTSDVK